MQIFAHFICNKKSRFYLAGLLRGPQLGALVARTTPHDHVSHIEDQNARDVII